VTAVVEMLKKNREILICISLQPRKKISFVIPGVFCVIAEIIVPVQTVLL